MTPSAPSLKNRFPFRLGTSSYILPDAILPNVRFLADLVDDVELVLFESDEISNLPSPQEIDELASIAAARDLTYTVHLPLDAKLGSPDEPARRRSVASCARIVALTRPLRPFAYVTHLYGETESIPAPAQDVERWHRNLALSIAELADAGVAPRDLCVETLAYPFHFIEPLVGQLGLSVCLDVGHLLLGGYSLAGHLARLRDRIRVVHLHGIENGRDHVAISHLAPEVPALLFSQLKDDGQRGCVVTLEVFSRSDFELSMEAMAARLHPADGDRH